MKRIYQNIVVLLFFVVTIAAQDRPRNFDNFDTQRGVQVRSTPSPEPGKPLKTQNATKQAPKHYLPSPAVGDEYKKALASRPVIVENSVLVNRTALVTRADQAWDRERSVSYTAAGSRQSMASHSELNGFSTGDSLIDSFILDSCRRYRIDPLLIYAQMAQESSFKLRATSNKGASGLMQLMPQTAKRMGVTNIYDPQQNIEGGVKYMRLLLDMFDGDVSLALAGYNAGEGAVIRYGYQIPPFNETQDYVRIISMRYNAFTRPNTASGLRRKLAE